MSLHARNRPEPVIVSVVGSDLVPIVRELLREYQRELNEDRCFERFEQELEALPGDCAPPRGRLLLAYLDAQPVGCVALRPIDEQTAEVRRLYVRPAHRGRGLGRALLHHLLRDARQLGFRRLRLDTLPSMHHARALYASMGFRPLASAPPHPVPGGQWMELDLDRAEVGVDRAAVRDAVMQVLRTVRDPEIPVNIVDLGLVYDVQVAGDGHVRVRMTLTTPGCPVAQSMPGEIAARLRALADVRDATVDIVWDPPWTPQRMSATARLALDALGVAAPGHLAGPPTTPVTIHGRRADRDRRD